MGVINVLDFQVANLIAAGEVVERPSSAVKELLENSIDAGADKITVEIHNGGISFIRVSDNGKGMSREDVPVSIKRHATSKIHEAKDLDGIMTLGFRGEALAAISSVSNLRIMTKTKDDAVGTLLTSYPSGKIEVTDAGCPVGTTVIIEELFGNVPARRKFLKKDMTEGMAVASVVEKIALSHPDVSIKFISDGNMKFNTQGDGKLINAIYAVMGRDFSKKLTPVSTMTTGIEISGYIGNPDNIRANRNYEIFFINGRYVKSKTAAAALEQAYDSFIPSEKFPCCILNINIHPAFVDVNVHPAKLEVKFSDDRPIFSAVYSAVRNTLESNISRPEFEPTFLDKKIIEGRNIINVCAPLDDRTEKREELQTTFTPEMSTKPSLKQTDSKALREQAYKKLTEEASASDTASVQTYRPDIPFEFSGEEKEEEPVNKRSDPEQEPLKSGDTQSSPANVLPFYKIIGEAFYSYIFVELTDRVLIIDKHAAHERIIFEELKRNLYSSQSSSQILLIPLNLEISSIEEGALSDYEKEIRATGFEFEHEAGSKTVKITEVPSGLDCNAASDMFVLILGRLAEGTGGAQLSRDMIYEKVLYQASCKAAVKAGRMDADDDIKALVEKILVLPDIKYCPHGRPVAFELSKANFERQFKRS